MTPFVINLAALCKTAATSTTGLDIAGVFSVFNIASIDERFWSNIHAQLVITGMWVYEVAAPEQISVRINGPSTSEEIVYSLTIPKPVPPSHQFVIVSPFIRKIQESGIHPIRIYHGDVMVYKTALEVLVQLSQGIESLQSH